MTMDKIAPPLETSEKQALEDAFVDRMMEELGFVKSRRRSYESVPRITPQAKLIIQATRLATVAAIKEQLLLLARTRLATYQPQIRDLLEMLASHVAEFSTQPPPPSPHSPHPAHEGRLMYPPRPGCPQRRDGEPARSGRDCPLLDEHQAQPRAGSTPPMTPEARAEAILASSSDELLNELLHCLWTKAVGTEGYVKREWQALEIVLCRMSRKLKGDNR